MNDFTPHQHLIKIDSILLAICLYFFLLTHLELQKIASNVVVISHHLLTRHNKTSQISIATKITYYFSEFHGGCSLHQLIQLTSSTEPAFLAFQFSLNRSS